MNATDYFQLPAYAHHNLIQLIDGEVVIGSPPPLKHQDLVRNILILLVTIEREQGGLAMVGPTEVYLDDRNIFEPDVLYIKSENLAIAQQDDKRIIGAPDLVVEVLSPSTAKIDRDQKYTAYEQNRVGEYWIVDPAHDVIEVWTLGQGGQFQRQGAFAGEDTFESVTLGETIHVKDIFDI